MTEPPPGPGVVDLATLIPDIAVLRQRLEAEGDVDADSVRDSQQFLAQRRFIGHGPGDGQLDASARGLRPAMTLMTDLIAIRRVPMGEAVGYGGTWRAPRDSLVGIAAIGYGDGYRRSLSGTGACVLVRGRRCPLLGRVTMDQIMVETRINLSFETIKTTLLTARFV